VSIATAISTFEQESPIVLPVRLDVQVRLPFQDQPWIRGRQFRQNRFEALAGQRPEPRTASSNHPDRLTRRRRIDPLSAQIYQNQTLASSQPQQGDEVAVDIGIGGRYGNTAVSEAERPHGHPTVVLIYRARYFKINDEVSQAPIRVGRFSCSKTATAAASAVGSLAPANSGVTTAKS